MYAAGPFHERNTKGKWRVQAVASFPYEKIGNFLRLSHCKFTCRMNLAEKRISLQLRIRELHRKLAVQLPGGFPLFLASAGRISVVSTITDLVVTISAPGRDASDVETQSTTGCNMSSASKASHAAANVPG